MPKKINCTNSVILIILLCILTRLPQLLSPYLFLDGDECVTATMGKYLLKGKDFSLFFWGQRYGFTFFESASIVPFYALLGIHTLAVKLGILSLWTLGVVFLYKILLLFNRDTPMRAMVLTVIFICLPAWAVWAMKARGGYVTAFTLSNISIFLLLNPATKNKLGYTLLTGLLLTLIYESQRLWLTGLLPIILFRMLQEHKWRFTFALFLSALASYLLLWYYKQDLPAIYNPSFDLPAADQILPRIKRFPEYLYQSFHGQYYFEQYQAPYLPGAVLSLLCTVLFFLLGLTGLYYLAFKRKGNDLFILSTLFLAFTFAYSLLFYRTEGRYLLPVTGFAFISLSIHAAGKPLRQWMRYPAVLLIVTGLLAMISFWNFQFKDGEKERITALLTYLRQHEYQYCYSTDCMLPWLITFYSNEQILCRTPFYPGRNVALEAPIEQAFQSGNTRHVAVLGYIPDYRNMHLPDTSFVCNALFVSPPPDSNELYKAFVKADLSREKP